METCSFFTWAFTKCVQSLKSFWELSSGDRYRIPCQCLIPCIGSPSKYNGIRTVFSGICKVSFRNSQLGFQNGNNICISNSKFFISLLLAYPKKKSRIRRYGMIAESVANVNSGTYGSEWWDNIGGGAHPHSSDVVWPTTCMFTSFLCIFQVHLDCISNRIFSYPYW